MHIILDLRSGDVAQSRTENLQGNHLLRVCVSFSSLTEIVAGSFICSVTARCSSSSVQLIIWLVQRQVDSGFNRRASLSCFVIGSLQTSHQEWLLHNKTQWTQLGREFLSSSWDEFKISPEIVSMEEGNLRHSILHGSEEERNAECRCDDCCCLECLTELYMNSEIVDSLIMTIGHLSSDILISRSVLFFYDWFIAYVT